MAIVNGQINPESSQVSADPYTVVTAAVEMQTVLIYLNI